MCGAAGVGSNAGNGVAGAGGAGLASSITGSSVTRAVGGSGNTNTALTAANNGNGGNGTASNVGTSPNGNAGVVIIAYPNTFADLVSIGAGLTYTLSTVSRSGYKVYTFTAGTGSVII